MVDHFSNNLFPQCELFDIGSLAPPPSAAQRHDRPTLPLFDEFSGDDRARWLYTAITRASETVRIVRGVNVGGTA
jgi:hypothetical protein